MAKPKGYLVFDDSKAALQVFSMEDPDIGYELAMEIYYGSERSYVERVLYIVSEIIELDNLDDILLSDKFMIKFN